jgi:hypothetical protein
MTTQPAGFVLIEPKVARNRQVNRALLAWLATQAALPPEDAMDPVSRDDPTRVGSSIQGTE